MKDTEPGPSQSKGKYREVPEPEGRPSIEEVIYEIEQQDWYKEQITYKRVFAAREGQTGKGLVMLISLLYSSSIAAPLDPPLSDEVAEALRSTRKITSLYTHQVAAIHALSQGKNVIVSTSTASGKSVIYQASGNAVSFMSHSDMRTGAFNAVPGSGPSIHSDLCISHQGTYQIFYELIKSILTVEKALAQDQRLALEQLLYSCQGLEHIQVSTYDGDTLQELRSGAFRKDSCLVGSPLIRMQASVKRPRSFLPTL